MHATFAGHVLLREPTPSAPATVGATPTAASDNAEVVDDDRDSKWEDIEDDDVNPLDIEAELDEGGRYGFRRCQVRKYQERSPNEAHRGSTMPNLAYR